MAMAILPDARRARSSYKIPILRQPAANARSDKLRTEDSMSLLAHARSIAAFALALLLAGCQSYRPLPLDPKPALAERLSDLRYGPGSLDPSRPLSIDDVAFLAVENNPDLRAARMARGIAEAQILQAGLLPNPQLTGEVGFLLGGPGTATAWMAALGLDVKALVTLSATRQAAGFEAAKVDADLLWQEWQVIAKARLLVIDTIEQQKLRALLAEERGLFADRYARAKRAVDQGNLPLSALAPDLVALSDVEKLIADFDRQAAARRQELAALLGMSPDLTLPLAPEIALAPVDPAAVAGLLPELGERRPDLVALRLGYAAQEERLRGAILAQFPNLVLGGFAARDTTNIRSGGPSITIDLPIFNRNQGNIAIEGATRQKLHLEYANRLAAAAGEVRALLATQTLLAGQLAEAQARLPEAEDVAGHADAAFRAGNLDERGYVELATTVIAQRQNIVALQQQLLEQQVAMATLTGAGLPLALSAAPAPGGDEASR